MRDGVVLSCQNREPSCPHDAPRSKKAETRQLWSVLHSALRIPRFAFRLPSSAFRPFCLSSLKPHTVYLQGRYYMKNKLIVWGLILAVSVIVLPAAALASSETAGSLTNYEHSAGNAPQQRGRGGSRGRGRGRGHDDHLERGHRSRHHARSSSHHGTRTVKKVFYRNGRRYVRSVRVHY